MAAMVDPILSRFRAALDEVYGERIERVVLFGSRARGDARPDSDYDVAVFLKDLDGFGKEAGTIAEIETDILADTGVVINALPLQAGSHREYKYKEISDYSVGRGAGVTDQEAKDAIDAAARFIARVTALLTAP
jgi:uncharacterized protein